MRETVDPNELLPLTELANKALRERLRKVPEFATSARWQASAIVVRLAEGMGFEGQVGFELRTPLDAPFQDVIAAWGSSAGAAVRGAVDEWVEAALPGALAIHSDKDPAAKLGVAPMGGWLFSWRLAEGPVRAVGADADTVMAELKKNGLYERLGLAGAMPWQREVAWYCVKLRVVRGEGGQVTVEARLNDEPWASGAELLKRFALPGGKQLDVKQYLFVRRTGKRPLAAGGAGAGGGSAGGGAGTAKPAGKKPWWKVW